MAERNIYGMPDCQLPNGDLCPGPCCWKFRVTLGDLNEGPFKAEESPCPHQAFFKNHGNRGCDLHGTFQKPYRCVADHCGHYPPYQKIELLGVAVGMGLISEEDAITCAKMWVNGSEDNLREFIFSGTEYFTEKIKQGLAPLEYFEFDQP